MNFVDESAGRVVDALKKKGMWENTLFVMSSDNGGPTYPGINAQLHGGASNFPLKGSKTSSWEGGIRVTSMAAGGLIPPKMRGTVSTEYVHISDWYTYIFNLNTTHLHTSYFNLNISLHF